VSPTRTFFAVPSQTNYVAQSFRTVPYTHGDSAALLLLGQALSTCYLHREIREKGGAYGGGATASVLGGTFSFTSYRDPRTLATLATFRSAAAWAAAEGSFSERDLAEAKLRAFKQLDAPVSPQGKGATLFMSGLGDEVRQAFRSRVLAVSTADLARVASTYLLGGAAEAAAAVAIVGTKDKISLAHGEDGWQVLDARMQPVLPAAAAAAVAA
jgi:Zn-dependent M16 (insulinase) family peptidase